MLLRDKFLIKSGRAANRLRGIVDNRINRWFSIHQMMRERFHGGQIP
jgi:hypothetical protein